MDFGNSAQGHHQTDENALVSSSLCFAHDIRSPLAALSLLLENTQANTPANDLLKMVVVRLEDMVGSYLATIRNKSKPLSSDCDLESVVHTVIAEKRLLLGAERFRLTIKGTKRIVQAEPTSLCAAFANLLQNALDATPEDLPVEVNVVFGEWGCRIFIRDHGPGMLLAPSQIGQLGATKGKALGSGIGLFQVNRAVQGIGATLRHRTLRSKGTIFMLALKYADFSQAMKTRKVDPCPGLLQTRSSPPPRAVARRFAK